MNQDLPIHALAPDLAAAWRAHKSLVLIAPTGSGKSTQVPQLLDAAGVCAGKRIVVLQPRRVAARSVAARVAEEMRVAVGAAVGYQVRFDEKIGADTRIAFVTEGILLRWLQRDPLLSDIGAVLFDEFHERNLLSDIALALCKGIPREDLKLIVMSATLEAEPVARYLSRLPQVLDQAISPPPPHSGGGGEIAHQVLVANGSNSAPVLRSDGRSYPVEIAYQSWGDDGPVWERAAAQIGQIVRTTREGDVLAFMPGMNEILRTIDEVRALRLDNVALLPMHGEMSLRDQDRVFAPSSYRRVIVATNVAETSLTIPGIRFVVDSGQARIARYDPGRGINTLHIEPISRASADQRAGRAGRTAPGVCYRLWSEPQHVKREAKNTPEIQRTELSAALLAIHAQGVRDIAAFDFLDKPEPARLAAAEDLLASLGAIDADGAITETGHALLRLPVHPRYARMLIEAERFGCVREAALLAALVSGRDILMRIRPRDERDRVIKRNRETLIKRGQKTTDYFLLANSYAFAESCGFDGKQCAMHGVNAHIAREVRQTFEQLLTISEEAGLLIAPFAGDSAALADAIAHCHLVGFLDHLAVRTSSGSNEYDLAGGKRCELMDESLVGTNMLIVASEIREISAHNGDRFTLLGVASAVKLEWVRALNPAGLSETVEHVYDRLNKRVVAGRVTRYHDLLLGGERVEQLDPAIAARVLADEFADQLTRLPKGDQLARAWAGKPREEIVALLAAAWHGAVSWSEAQKRELSV
jgi:ATP-dependent helicase HrpB